MDWVVQASHCKCPDFPFIWISASSKRTERYLSWIYSNRRKSTLDFCLLLGYRKMKTTCSHLSMSWIKDKIITLPEPLRGHNLKLIEVQTPVGREIIPSQKARMPVSRNKYYLSQLTILPKMSDIQSKIKHANKNNGITVKRQRNYPNVGSIM